MKYGRAALMFITLIIAIRFRMGRGGLDFRCNKRKMEKREHLTKGR